MNPAVYPSTYPWPAWRRGSVRLLLFALLDCLGAGVLLQAGFLAISSGPGSGPHNATELCGWLVAIGWTAGITAHLVALQRAVKHHQKADASVLLASGLLLTGLCQLVMTSVVYAAVVVEVLRAVFRP